MPGRLAPHQPVDNACMRACCELCTHEAQHAAEAHLLANPNLWSSVRWSANHALAEAGGPLDLRDAKVSEFDLPVFIQQNVGRLEVLMNDTQAMQVPQHICKVCGDDKNLPKREPRVASVLMHIVVQSAPGNVLQHHDIVLTIMPGHRPTVAPDDAVMCHAHHQLHLCDELAPVLHNRIDMQSAQSWRRGLRKH